MLIFRRVFLSGCNREPDADISSDQLRCISGDGTNSRSEYRTLHPLLDVLITKMPSFDPYNDPTQILTVRDSLASALDKDKYQTAPSGIFKCPNEILDYIFQHIGKNHDLAQLCKVSKRFFAIALPRLYRTLRILIKPKLGSGMIQMLTHENTGLRFVRKFIAEASKEFPSESLLMHQCLLKLIHHLPHHKLREFWWVGGEPLPAAILSTLWLRQPNLKLLDIVPEVVSSLRDGETDPQRQLQSLQFPDLDAVRVVLKRVDDAKTAAAALQLGDVDDLMVDAVQWQGRPPREYNPNVEASDPDGEAGERLLAPESGFTVVDSLTENLFHHLQRVKPGCTPSHDKLVRLYLKDVDLTLSRHTWFTYLNLKNLNELNIKYCKGADKFLLILSNIFPTLVYFQLVHWLGKQSDCTIHAIEELLNYMPAKGLIYLRLCLRNANDLPSVLPIIKHKETLQVLLLDIAKKARQDPSLEPEKKQPQYEYEFYDKDDFQLLIKSCYNLQELGIALPCYGLYFVSLPSARDGYDLFGKYINFIAKNLHLSTLNIVNWPHNYKHGKNESYYLAKNASLARLAAAIFDRHRSWNAEIQCFDTVYRHIALEVIAFGIAEQMSPPATPRPVYFLQCEGNTLGDKHWLANEVSLGDLRNHALDVGVLQYTPRDFDKASRKDSGAFRHEDYDSDDDDSQAGLE